MDNFDINKSSPHDDLNEPIPFDDDSSANNAGVSHSPLNLSGGSPAPVSKIEAPPGTVVKKQGEKVVSVERITGVKTFFTKLHAGAIEFLDEIIGKWLKENPDVSIKMTNMITGEIQGKKTEPNIIITVWY
ncbi:MAG: hypothetical protein WC476_06975 [Phycisphaerae bacterium]|jgi:DNA-binding Lrp family transcriptional regulator